MTVPDRSDDSIIHSIGGAQSKFPASVIEHIDGTGLGIGELCRLGDDGSQDGLKIESRVHRLADLTERPQLAHRLAEFARARLHLVEQPHVLDRDYRLVGERAKQLDLHIAEQASIGPTDSNSADGASFPQHWHCKQCAEAGGKSCILNIVVRVRMDVRNMNDRTIMDRVMPDSFTDTHRAEITSLAARYRLPAVYPFRLFAEAGGLLSYGLDRSDNFRRAATYVDRILKGEKPSELPVQAPVKFDLVINLKAAIALGLEVPAQLLGRADEVIE